MPGGIWIVSAPGVSPEETIACRIEQLAAQKPVSSAVVFTTNGSAAAGEAAARRAMIVVARIPFQRMGPVYRLGLAVYDLPLRSVLVFLRTASRTLTTPVATVVRV